MALHTLLDTKETAEQFASGGGVGVVCRTQRHGRFADVQETARSVLENASRLSSTCRDAVEAHRAQEEVRLLSAHPARAREPSLGQSAVAAPSDTASVFCAGEVDGGVRSVWQQGGGGWQEGAASVRGVHYFSAILQWCVPEGELAKAQERVQGEPC